MVKSINYHPFHLLPVGHPGTFLSCRIDSDGSPDTLKHICRRVDEEVPAEEHEAQGQQNEVYE